MLILASRRSALQAGKLADGDDTPLLESNRVGPCRVMSQGFKAWFSSWWFSATALSWGELWYTVDSQNNSMYLVRAWVFLQQSHGPGLLAVSLKLVSFWTTWAIGAWFNQMSPGSRTVGSRIQRLHWGGLWCFPSGKVEGDETEAWNEPQDPIRSAT